MTKIEKLINKKVDREDYDKFVNPIHQKMIDENGNKKPTFKERLKKFFTSLYSKC